MSKVWMHRIAWALGAFTLVILGAVWGQILQTVQAGVPDRPTVEMTPTPAADPNLEALLQEREQAYRQLIAEANTRLQQAYQQIQELSAQIQGSSAQIQEPSAQQAEASGAPAMPQARVSPAQAIWIAMNVVPGSALMKEPELVLFQGVLAYEVVLDQGTLYIDANTGQILYNGIPPVIQVVQAQPSPEKGGGDGKKDKSAKAQEKKKKDEHKEKENKNKEKDKQKNKKKEHENEHRDDD